MSLCLHACVLDMSFAERIEFNCHANKTEENFGLQKELLPCVSNCPEMPEFLRYCKCLSCSIGTVLLNLTKYCRCIKNGTRKGSKDYERKG